MQAALDQIKAQAQRDAAALDYARANFNRGDELVKSGFVAKDTLDQRESAMRQAQAALTMDQAAVRTAELNLGYAEIRAPFSGRIGRNQAPVGTLVSVAGTTLNTLVQLDPIYVTFNPSETELTEIQKARCSGQNRGRGRRARRERGASQGRAHLHRQCGRPHDRHHHGARHHRQCRFHAFAGPICARSPASEGRARCAARAADGTGIEPARQIRLCRGRPTTRPSSAS